MAPDGINIILLHYTELLNYFHGRVSQISVKKDDRQITNKIETPIYLV